MFRFKHKFQSPLTAIAIAVFSITAAAQVPQSGEQIQPVNISPDQLSNTFAAVTKMVEPAVVSIDTKGKMPEVTTRGDVKPGDSDDVLEFFRRQLPQRPAYSVGSGFIVDKRGYIMTNKHVVEGAERISVKLDSGEEYLAKVVGEDHLTDLAVLKIEAGKDLPFVKLGDSTRARVGDWVLALGSPFGLSRSVTAGIVSQTNRATPSANAFQRFIQTDAAINRGNSGGPLVNMRGEVIGINSQIATSNGDSSGVGFAFPSSEAAVIYDQILKSGKVRRGFLGVSLESVRSEFAKVYGMKDAKGAIVLEVIDPKSAAGVAGLKSGDVIVEFNGRQVESAQDLISKISSTPPDQSVSLYYLRENAGEMERKSTSLTLGERESEAPGPDPVPVKLPITRVSEDTKPFGLTLTPLTADVALMYGLANQKGLLVKAINPASYIADVKSSSGREALDEGDLIQRINRQPVTDLRSFSAIASKLAPGDAVVLHVLTFEPRNKTKQNRIV